MSRIATAGTGEQGQGQVQMSVRLPADLAQALEQAARSEDRTVSAELRRIIRRHVLELRQGVV
jgi:predicted DNA-binding protein